MAEVGFPPGVVNIVPGLRPHGRGSASPSTPASRKIAFTGSTAIGRQIVEASAGNLKRVQLELGGKGANIVFDDADLPAAVNGSAFAIFHNQGQACIAGSRLILHEPIADEFLERFLDAGPLHPARRPARPGHRDGAAHLARAPRPGARATSRSRATRAARCCSAARRPTTPRWPRAATSSRRSCGPSPRDRVCQEEVFGPFVTVTTFDDEEEALAHRQRHRLRPRRRAVDARPAARPPRRRRDPHAAWSGSTATSGSTPGSPFGGVGAVRLRPRDGLRGHARVHRGQVGLGQRRRAAPAVVPEVSEANGPSGRERRSR